MSKLFAVILAVVVLIAGLKVVGFAQPAEANVLFIGNSYTIQNDLPGVVSDITNANGMKIEVDRLATGGFKLSDHLNSLETFEAMAKGYDLVVIQEQSMMPASTFLDSETIPAAKRLANRARAEGSRVVFFQTWAHRSGNREIGHSSYASMRDALVEGYGRIGRAAGGEVAPAGLAWDQALRSQELDGVQLYVQDGSHPTPQGTYVAAAAIAGTIMGQKLSEAPSSGVSGDEAAALLAAANQVLPYR